MAIHFKLSKRTAVVSAGIFSLAVISKQLAPFIIEFVIPVCYTSVLSWLQPPFLYLVMNIIILTIVVTSKFQHNKPIPNDLPSLLPEIILLPDITVTNLSVEEKKEDATFIETRDDKVAEVFTLLDPPAEAAERFVTIENDSQRPPLSSARFGNKKSAKGGGGTHKTLKVTKTKRQDTLESTWKTITEGRSMPLTRHLKKSDTWDSRVRTTITSVSPAEPSKIEKSESFEEHSDETSTTVVDSKLRKEPSLSQDEVNRKVEAFIKKFNEEMRLQRQKSLEQYKQMASIY